MLYHHHDCNDVIQSSDRRTGTRKAAHTTWYIFHLYETYFDYFFITFYFHLVNIAVKEKSFSIKIILWICKIVNGVHVLMHERQRRRWVRSYQLYCLSNAILEVREKNSYHVYFYCFLGWTFKKFDYCNSIDLKFNSEQSAEFILFCHNMTLHFMGGKTNVSVIKTCSDTHWNDHTNGMFCSEETFFLCKWR